MSFKSGRGCACQEDETWVVSSGVVRVSATSRCGRGPPYAPPALCSGRERGSCRRRDRKVRCVPKCNWRRPAEGGARCLLLAQGCRHRHPPGRQPSKDKLPFTAIEHGGRI